MAETVGKAKIVAEFDNKEALNNLERYRRRLMETGRSYDKLFKEDITRKFSENFRKGFEQGVLRGVEKGENKFYQLERAIGIAASSLDKIKAPAQMAADSFFKLQRAGIKFQAAAGTITGAVGDLVGGFYSLVGVVGAAAPSLVALGSTMVGVGVGFVGVKVAMAGVSEAIGAVWKSQTALNDTFRAATQEYIGLKFAAEGAALSQEDAALKLEAAREALARVQDLPPDNRLRRQTELAFKQADLQLRQAKHKSEESFRAVKKGIEATSAYQPLASLSAVQLEFVKFVVTLRPLMQQMKKEVAAGFIPKLTEAIQTLMKYGFPEFKNGLKQVASAMGTAAKVFANAFKDDTNILNLRSLFDSSTKTIGHFGKAVASSFGAFLSILNAAVPLTERFAKFISKSLGNLDKNLKFKDFNGDLNRTFFLAGNVADRIGSVFKGVYDGVKNIVKAAFPSGSKSGAGGVMLDFLDDMINTFKKFTSDKGFSEWMKNATTGAVEILRTVGQFLAIFTDLAGNKKTADFFIILRDAIPYVKTILENGQKAGTELANVLVSFTRIIAAVADAGVIVTFFDTLNIVLKILADVLMSPAFQAFLNFIGHIHGPILALGAVVLIAMKAFKIFFGYMMNGLTALAKFSASMKAADRSFVVFRKETAMARQHGESFFRSLGQISRAARDSRLLQLSRDAGVAKDRLAQLELQMLSNASSAALYNENTKKTIQYQNMNQEEALQMAVRYERLALEAGMAGKEVQALNAQLLYNIEAAKGGRINNQSLLAGTAFADGNYRAPYMAGAPGGAGGGGGGVTGPGGKSGFMRTAGGIFRGKGFGNKLGMGGIAGGLGMAATVGSSMVGLGTGVTSEVGMAVQAIAGVASMFGPAGMVAGGLLSIGTTIVDGIIAAEKERAQQIKFFKITTANMSVENMNEIKDFGSRVLQSGFAKTRAQVEVQGVKINQKALQNFSVGAGSIKSAQDLADAAKEFSAATQKSFNLSKLDPMQDVIQQTIGTVANFATGLTKEEVGTVLGKAAGIKESSQASVLQNLVDTGVVSKEYTETLKKTLDYGGAGGTLTQDSFKKFMSAIAKFSQNAYLLEGGRNPLNLPTSGYPQDLDGTRKRRGLDVQPQFLPEVTPLNYAPISKVLGPRMSRVIPNVSDTERVAFDRSYKLPKVSEGLKTAGLNAIGDLLTNKDLFKVNQFGGIDYKSSGAQQQVLASVSNLATLLTGKINGTITKENRKYYDFGNYRYDEADFTKFLKSKNMPDKKIEDYKKTYGKTEEGFNVAGTYFNEDLFKRLLKTLEVIDENGKTMNAFEVFKEVGGLDIIAKVGQDAVTGKTGNAIIDSVNRSATEQITTFKTATQNTKDAAATIGTAAAKFEGYGALIANNTNKAIAFAIVAASKEGKTALAENDYSRINTLLNAELKKLGLATK